MGDRVAVQFEDPQGDRSAVLYSQNGGAWLAMEAGAYARNLSREMGDRDGWPLERLEADVVILGFLHHLIKWFYTTGLTDDCRLVDSTAQYTNLEHGHRVIRLVRKSESGERREKPHPS